MTVVIAKALATEDPRSSWIKQMRSLAIILREEFGIAFHFYDAATGSRLEVPAPDLYPWAPTTSKVVAANVPTVLEGTIAARIAGEAAAWVESLEGGCYQLVLPFADAGGPSTVAVGVIAGLARTPAEVFQEQARLEKWLNSVHLRLQVATQGAVERRRRHGADRGPTSLVGLEALMALEDLLRTQRIDTTSGTNHRQILQAVARVLRARTVIWFPALEDEAVIEGEPLLASCDCARLARLVDQDPDGARTGYLLNNQVQASRWGSRFPQLVSLLAVPVPVKHLASWVIALNKSISSTSPAAGSSRGSSGFGCSGEAAFGRTDAALLLPFAALLAVHLRAERRHRQ